MGTVTSARPLDADAPLRLRMEPHQLARPGSRLVVVAPHPDDELLGIGGTLAWLARAGHASVVVAVTDGSASHPDSTRWPRDVLVAARARETAEALQRLGWAPERVRLNFDDGAVPAAEAQLADALAALLAPDDTVFVPWHRDGHADHESTARATRTACERTGTRWVEFPVWALVPGHPAETSLHGVALWYVALPSDVQDAKRHAIDALHTQLEPDDSTGALPVLAPHARAAWQQPDECVIAPAWAGRPL